MSLEEQIDLLIQKHSDSSCYLGSHAQKIHTWQWLGQPYSECTNRCKDLYLAIENMILKTDTNICLTSTCEYIRQCRTYYVRNSKMASESS